MNTDQESGKELTSNTKTKDLLKSLVTKLAHDPQVTEIVKRLDNDPLLASAIEKANGRIGRTTAGLVDVADQQVRSLSLEEQRDIGKRLFREFRKKHKAQGLKCWFLINSRVRRLYDLAAPILSQSTRGNNWYSFYVIKDKDENAFTHVGGYVYVSRGMLMNARYSTDRSLQFVLAHEIAHEELGHNVRSMALSVRAGERARIEMQKRMGLIGETLVGVLAGGMAACMVQERVDEYMSKIGKCYSQVQEYAADAWSAQAMIKAGYSQLDCCEYLRTIMAKDNTPPPKSGLKTVLKSYVDSHPHPQRRLENLAKIWTE